MNFWKTSEWGGGVISDPKIFVAVFSVIFLGEKGGGHANPNEFRCKFSGLRKKAQHSFPKIGWGGGVRGRLEVFRKFSEFGRGSLPLELTICEAEKDEDVPPLVAAAEDVKPAGGKHCVSVDR